MSTIQDFQKQLDTLRADYDESLDTIWMLWAGLLAFFMHAGFILVESGSVRFKDAHDILAKKVLVVTVGFLCWYVLGWPLASGALEDPNNKTMYSYWLDKTEFRTWFFQGAFCAIACTIVSGAMAERTQLKGFAMFCVWMTSIIYPIVAYWGWSASGFLAYKDDAGASVSSFGPAFMDFGGSGIVHLVGGTGALIGSACVGARKGRFDAEGTAEFVARNLPFCVLGTFCLWFGWYGCNSGSTLSMKTVADAHKAGSVAMNTTLAPCMSGLLVFFLRATVCSPKLLDVGGFCNGILAGLVSISAGSAFVKPWEAVIIGSIGGLIYQGASMLLVKLKIDDVVDAFPVHGACGIWGVLAIGLFGNPDEGMGGNGLFYGGDQFKVQVIGVIVIMAWTAGLCLLIFTPLLKLGMLRSCDKTPDAGAAITEHYSLSCCQDKQIKTLFNCFSTTASPLPPGEKEVSAAFEI
jgi:Amt family ammonium transporter